MGLPKRLLGNAHTKPGWSGRDRSVLSVQEALGFGYGSEIELKACLLPVYQRFQHPVCKRAERWGGAQSAVLFFFMRRKVVPKCQVTYHWPRAPRKRSQGKGGCGLLLISPVACFKSED